MEIFRVGEEVIVLCRLGDKIYPLNGRIVELTKHVFMYDVLILPSLFYINGVYRKAEINTIKQVHVNKLKRKPELSTKSFEQLVKDLNKL